MASYGTVCIAVALFELALGASVFNTAHFGNVCKNHYGDLGTCSSASDCSNKRGVAIGWCFSSSQEVCCHSSLPCSQLSNEIFRGQPPRRIRRATIISNLFPAHIDPVCGLSEKDSSSFDQRDVHLVNGVDISGNNHMYPWMLALWIRFKGFSVPTCGAALISNRHAITAAHCVSNSKLRFILRGGSVINRLPTKDEMMDMEDENDHGGVVIEIKAILMHPSFNPFNFENDIALLTLVDTVRASKDLFPVCLPPPLGATVTDYSGSEAAVTGCTRISIFSS
jgi:hypothetical protein